jgi:hypothetical protein
MPEKNQSGIGISTGIQLLQSGIRVSPLVTDCSGVGVEN